MKISVQTKSGEFQFECDPGETILNAGLRHGVTLPYECATGTCGTCRGRVVTGDVVMGWEEAPGAARLKREKGDCLMCQTVVRSDTLIRVASHKVQGSFERGAVPRHYKGVIEAPNLLTNDVLEFDLVLDQAIDFDAGQFMALRCDAVTGARAYSMVNHDAGTNRLRFVVKRTPGGAFSDWLFDGKALGASLDVFGPLGAAAFYPDEGKHMVCIAGGSGIAGIMSILARACAENYFARRTGHVFFGVRTMADCFYLPELAAFAASAGGNLEVTVALSEEDTGHGAHPEHTGIRLDTGFVHDAAARRMAGAYDDVIGYVAGPPPMVDAALRILIRDGKLPPTSIRYDKFS